jgi:hypothetical protein
MYPLEINIGLACCSVARTMRSLSRALAPRLSQRQVRSRTASSAPSHSSPVADALSWLGAAAVGGAAVAVVGQPLASPSTETPPAPASSHRSDDAKDGGGGAAHPHAQGGSTTSITSSGGDADVWLYDADGQIVATDGPQDESPPQVPVWYTEAAEEIATLDAAAGPAGPPGSTPWGHLYQVQPGSSSSSSSSSSPPPSSYRRRREPEVEIADGAEIAAARAEAPAASAAAAVDIGAIGSPIDEMPQMRAAAVETAVGTALPGPATATATDRTSEDSYTMWLRGSAGDSVSTPVASITAPLAPATAATATTFGIEAAVIDPVVTQEPLGISETELQHQQPSVAEPVRVYPQRCVTRGFVRVMLCARPNPHACGWLSR